MVSYRHMRQLELELIVRLNNLEGSQDSIQLDGSMGLSITLNQFYGIEIEEWPAQVARMALFLTDHQENLRLERITGTTPNRFPIKDFANIVNTNALRIDWKSHVEIDDNTFILGNPPFIGMSLMTLEQQDDRNSSFAAFSAESSRTGRLDYVTSWYAKAIENTKGTGAKCAFVSTNSITQGEQARTLGPFFINTGFEIDFAYPTFSWTSDSANAAAVHVVIVGFSEKSSTRDKRIFYVNDDDGQISYIKANNINFYLVNGSDIELVKRKAPIVAGLPDCTKGSQPTDGGNLFFKGKELENARNDPIVSQYLRRFIGATELLYSEDRYCLWLLNAKPQDLRNSTLIKERLAAVSLVRSKSPTISVQEQARTPSLFTQIRQPKGNYFAMPKVSGERRDYIPGAFFTTEEIAGDGVLTFPDAPLWLFGFLQSKAFTAWVATFSGRLGASFQILPAIVYFTFPFIVPSNSQKLELEVLCKDVLRARTENDGANLADLYDPLIMPANLRNAHNKLDNYIDALYSKTGKINSEERLNVLIEKYNEILSGEQLGLENISLDDSTPNNE